MKRRAASVGAALTRVRAFLTRALGRPAAAVRAPIARVLGHRAVIATSAAVLVFAAMFVSGSVDQSNIALGEMGFDPDRSQLISALLVGAVMAAAFILGGGGIILATLLGCAGAAALFGPTFVRETQSALATNGAAGAFDLGGWLITLPTLLVSGLVAGWAGAALATVARPALAETIATLTAAIRRRPVESRSVRRVAGVALAGLVLIATVPVFGDIVNYTPDSHMLQGRPQLIGLGGPALTPRPISAATPSPSGAAPPSTPPSPSTGPTPSTGPLDPASASPSDPPPPTSSPAPADPHPWLAWRPDGYGQLVDITLPGPWTNPNPAIVTIYLPPGYATDKNRRYPVIYQAPYYYYHWNDATNVNNALQTLMDTGYMPAAIVVSMSTEGGAYTDSECADSFDGREWFDSYAAYTVVQWIDSHYRTMAKPSARAVLGASQGGYCAAALAARHPDVFGTAMVFSGYYHAGMIGPPSTLPFGTDKDFIDAASPDVVVTRMPEPVKQKLYYIVVAKLSQALYGEEAIRFDTVLKAERVPHVVLDSAVSHGWAQLRIEFAGAMQAWAARMVDLGVFDSDPASGDVTPGL